MDRANPPLWIGLTPQPFQASQTRGAYVRMLGEPFYKISHFDQIEPFFINLASGSNHWLFIASTGGLTAGRIDAEHALFPYYTVDKITENNENTGNKAILRLTRAGQAWLWEPFSDYTRGSYWTEKNIYKNNSSTALIFEEINLDLHLAYRYAWRTGDRFGFVKTTWIANLGREACALEFLDGIQNILPANVSTATQTSMSNLLDAYKRAELHPSTGLAIYSLNSSLTDLAEPSESLLASTVGQAGLEGAGYLLSSAQLEKFRTGQEIAPEMEIRGQRGAYFVHARLQLAPEAERSWQIFADVDQDHMRIVEKIDRLSGEVKGLPEEIEADISLNQAAIHQVVQSVDGVQLSQDPLATGHQYSSAMYNAMRGGVFVDHYEIDRDELKDFTRLHSTAVLARQARFFAALPAKIRNGELLARAESTGDPDLLRLCSTYLPLTFSRRHGDPSRPWNRFQINVKKPDGTRRLDYAGNWRDIFQNWEALAWSFPEYVENMIATFLNATTVDGYNPYRVMYSGVDWEQPDPDSPWSNIGYWSDHQIIYLQKLMEISVAFHPGKLQQSLATPLFSYANVPYRIKPYAAVLADPYNTIEFDWELQETIVSRMKTAGSDARLVSDPSGQVLPASLAEKLLTLLLAKLANFVPEGGIWMNTQRPEWNDANNALVGKGLSVVTLGYLRRFLAFCHDLFSNSPAQDVPVRPEVIDCARRIGVVLGKYQPVLGGKFTDEQRRQVMDELGQAGSDYRWRFYHHGLSSAAATLGTEEICRLLALAQSHVDHSLRANQRDDQLYHSYNTLKISEDRAHISRLDEMLEGQVAILSSGLLTGEEVLALLAGLKSSRLYQAERHSYILYPDREVPGFLQKNTVAPEKVSHLRLVQVMTGKTDPSLLVKDQHGNFHFNGAIRNINDVNRILAGLQNQPDLAPLVQDEAEAIRELFEAVFHHAQFTGRSSTFFAYEGLGSIYWHMVSKLLLAAVETAVWSRSAPQGEPPSRDLARVVRDIRQGLGFKKTPAQFGAFPVDPYSHSPKDRGAKQPGMTGQVKEDLLARLAEVGLFVEDGQIRFDPFLLDRDELLAEPAEFAWIDLAGELQRFQAPAGALVYTFCQVPVVLQAGQENSIRVYSQDGKARTVTGNVLDQATSQSIFQRDGIVHHLVVHFQA